MKQVAKNSLLTVCLAVLAWGQTAKTTSVKKTAPATAKASASTAAPAPGPTGPISIPKDAVEIEPGLFQAKDASGKTWHYTRTPFGVRRFEPQQREDTTVEEASRISVVAQDGDSVTFERKTPWNSARWSKKKDKLNAAEKLALDRPAKQPRESATAAKAASAKP